MHFLHLALRVCPVAALLLLTPTPSAASSVIYRQEFGALSGGTYADADSALGGEWTFNSTNEGRARIYNWGGSRQGVLVLDDAGWNHTYSRNEAILSVDLTGLQDISLTFDHYDSNDEEHSLPSEFTGSRDGDGLAVSSNGTDWVLAREFSQPNQSWQKYTVNVSELIANSSLLQLSQAFLFKFQQYDNVRHPSDGRKFDNVTIAAVSSTSAVPEPQSYLLLAVAAVGLLVTRRRRQVVAA